MIRFMRRDDGALLGWSKNRFVFICFGGEFYRFMFEIGKFSIGWDK